MSSATIEVGPLASANGNDDGPAGTDDGPAGSDVAPDPSLTPAPAVVELEPAGTGSIDALYRDLYPALTRLAYLLTGSRDLAPDLVHDAVVRALPRLARVDDVGAYLRRCVVNETKMHWRHRDVVARHPEPDPAPVTPAEVDEVWDALGALPPRRRAALVLRFYEDMTIDDVAALGCRPGTARSLIHRGLESVRKVLQP